MLLWLSFTVQSSSFSTCDEQISGPNVIQAGRLCCARVALGEAEGEAEGEGD